MLINSLHQNTFFLMQTYFYNINMFVIIQNVYTVCLAPVSLTPKKMLQTINYLLPLNLKLSISSIYF